MGPPLRNCLIMLDGCFRVLWVMFNHFYEPMALNVPEARVIIRLTEPILKLKMAVLTLFLTP